MQAVLMGWSRQMGGEGGGSAAEMQPEGSLKLTPQLEARLDGFLKRHAVLCEKLNGKQQQLPRQELQQLSKELSMLDRSVAGWEQLKGVRREMAEVSAMEEEAGAEAEMRQLLAEEWRRLQVQESRLEGELVRGLLAQRGEDDGDLLLEVYAGAGGSEGALFAADLFGMYRRYAQLHGWQAEVVVAEAAEGGGLRFGCLGIRGPEAFGRLRLESGVHRVQRVPATEREGRVHTSTASVVVMLQPDEAEQPVSMSDIKVEVTRSQGAGGQHVNTTESAVRMTHLPTGLTVSMQDERCQHRNRAKALKVLQARVLQQQREQRREGLSQMRKASKGSGGRSEKIRTYNFLHGRVTDHRIQLTTHSIKDVLDGPGLDLLLDALAVQDQLQQLQQLQQ